MDSSLRHMITFHIITLNCLWLKQNVGNDVSENTVVWDVSIREMLQCLDDQNVCLKFYLFWCASVYNGKLLLLFILLDHVSVNICASIYSLFIYYFTYQWLNKWGQESSLLFILVQLIVCLILKSMHKVDHVFADISWYFAFPWLSSFILNHKLTYCLEYLISY